MSQRIYGAKYDKALELAEVAKRVRLDIRAAVEDGSLLCGIYSVTIQRYSMGRSITIRWSWHEIHQASTPLFNPERLRWDVEHPHEWDRPEGARERFSSAGVACQAKLEAILGAYNYDRPRTDAGDDSSDQNFHQHVTMDCDWQTSRASIERRHATGAKAEQELRDELAAVGRSVPKPPESCVGRMTAHSILRGDTNVVEVDFTRGKSPSDMPALDALLAAPLSEDPELDAVIDEMNARIDSYVQRGLLVDAEQGDISSQEDWLTSLGVFG